MMKSIKLVALMLICLPLCGCITAATITKAKGIDEKPAPGYYAVVPLSVAADVATSPIQLIWFIFASSQGGGH